MSPTFFDPKINKTRLAKNAEVGYAVVHRTDIFLYDAIPPTLLEYLAKNEPDLLVDPNGKSYHFAKMAALENQRRVLSLAKPFWLFGDLAFKYGSFVDWRSSVADTQMEFCRIFFINPTILANYENGTTKELPVVIRERLQYFGMSYKNLETLVERPVG